jgi:LPXTG-motif cell wall-anchored protein
VSAARRSSSTARRTLLTATAAGTLLGALWFVPSANATQNTPESPRIATSTTTDRTTTDTTGVTAHTQLADTGSVDTTPYVIGGTLFLGLGAGFVTYSVRRERTEGY